MNFPVTIEGAKYFVSMWTLKDLETWQTFLRREHRSAAFAAIPEGLSDADLKRWMRLINEECELITPENEDEFGKIMTTPSGVALMFYSILRHEQPHVTLEWVTQLMSRAEAGKPAALEAMQELRKAFQELGQAKKNELAQRKQLTVEKEVQESHSTSTESTST